MVVCVNVCHCDFLVYLPIILLSLTSLSPVNCYWDAYLLFYCLPFYFLGLYSACYHTPLYLELCVYVCPSYNLFPLLLLCVVVVCVLLCGIGNWFCLMTCVCLFWDGEEEFITYYLEEEVPSQSGTCATHPPHVPTHHLLLHYCVCPVPSQWWYLPLGTCAHFHSQACYSHLQTYHYLPPVPPPHRWFTLCQAFFPWWLLILPATLPVMPFTYPIALRLVFAFWEVGSFFFSCSVVVLLPDYFCYLIVSLTRQHSSLISFLQYNLYYIPTPHYFYSSSPHLQVSIQWLFSILLPTTYYYPYTYIYRRRKENFFLCSSTACTFPLLLVSLPTPWFVTHSVPTLHMEQGQEKELGIVLAALGTFFVLLLCGNFTVTLYYH